MADHGLKNLIVEHIAAPENNDFILRGFSPEFRGHAGRIRFFLTRIRILDTEMGNFSSDFLNIIKRHFF